MNFFNFFSSKQSSKDVAKERLKLILIHDRATDSLTPEVMDKIREEILMVISKYVEIDSEELEVKMTEFDECEGEYSPALVASIPIKKMKR